MRVAIDAREINKRRGMGHYCRELLFNLGLSKDSISEYDLWVIIPSDTSLAVQEKLSAAGFRLIKLPVIHQVIWDQVLLPLVAWLGRFDVLINPYNTAPIISIGFSNVVIVHDLIYLHPFRIKTGLNLLLGNLYRRLIFRLVLGGSTPVWTVSKYTSKLLHRFKGIDSELVENSCNHLSNLFLNAKKSENFDYFLHIGGDSGTKNTRKVIEAYREFKEIFSLAPSLIVMGVSSEFASIYKRQEYAGWLDFRINVSDEKKCDLIYGCLGVIFPSLKEGFGLPIIEAHMVEKLVLTSRRRPMKDIASAVDVLVDPTSVDDLVRGYSVLWERSKSGLRNCVAEGEQAFKVAQVMRNTLEIL